MFVSQGRDGKEGCRHGSLIKAQCDDVSPWQHVLFLSPSAARRHVPTINPPEAVDVGSAAPPRPRRGAQASVFIGYFVYD